MSEDTDVKTVLILLNDSDNSSSVFDRVVELGHSPIEVEDIETARRHIEDYDIDAVIFSQNVYETQEQRDSLPTKDAGFKFASELKEQHPTIRRGYYAFARVAPQQYQDILDAGYFIPHCNQEKGLQNIKTLIIAYFLSISIKY